MPKIMSTYLSRHGIGYFARTLQAIDVAKMLRHNGSGNNNFENKKLEK